ncbi:MAG: phosphorylase, partial [Xanthobacteraceae bacterium]
MILGTGDEPLAGDCDPRPVLIVTGLMQEARIAAGPGMTVICSSSNPRQLRSCLAGFDAASVRGVISFGVAGGLDPELESGDVVVANEVTAGRLSWLAGAALSEQLIGGEGLGGRRIVRARLA